ncbi:hypothetical protein [Pseudonocardia sp. GCM10023141]|uniref:hypothetical protein n=1 Tax=Pseudonocardia sp. GCM10023141 TaxID=3252653 RepID=UPI0036160508
MSRYEVRRDDGELLGFVEPDAVGGWRALSVFGAELATADDRDGAEEQVAAVGLAVLAERWWYRDGTAWVPATLTEAAPERVTAVVGVFPDTPRTLTLVGSAAAGLSRRPA